MELERPANFRLHRRDDSDYEFVKVFGRAAKMNVSGKPAVVSHAKQLDEASCEEKSLRDKGYDGARGSFLPDGRPLQIRFNNLEVQKRSGLKNSTLPCALIFKNNNGQKTGVIEPNVPYPFEFDFAKIQNGETVRFLVMRNESIASKNDVNTD